MTAVLPSTCHVDLLQLTEKHFDQSSVILLCMHKNYSNTCLHRPHVKSLNFLLYSLH